jgi:hypothetical protein
MVPEEQHRNSWYLEAMGSANGGACLDISFPYEKPPGPIDSNAAAELVGIRPFTMTFGQWKFIHGEYVYHRVQSLSSGSQGNEDTSSSSLGSAGHLRVDTNPTELSPPLLDESSLMPHLPRLVKLNLQPIKRPGITSSLW